MWQVRGAFGWWRTPGPEETALDSYDRAVAEKAALTVELKNAPETSEKAVLEAKSNAVVSGLNTYLALQRAYRDLEDKRLACRIPGEAEGAEAQARSRPH